MAERKSPVRVRDQLGGLLKGGLLRLSRGAEDVAVAEFDHRHHLNGARTGGSAIDGGSVGAKRMRMSFARYSQAGSDHRKLGVGLIALVRSCLVAETDLGQTVDGYAPYLDVFVAKFLENIRLRHPLAGVAVKLPAETGSIFSN